ncbi:MAG: glycosyltransferase family 4 protein [Bacteroidetes bacterium]|nr:glycosyltransferase family 4 protein [Bacteroidota bacterium]MBS1649252.1 glycosyltransferase family 4 protein [Bacteroidota bacterium]
MRRKELPSILFLYLTGFSFTGGIEKFNRSFLKALHELSVDDFIDGDAYSSYDHHSDEKYFPRLRFKGFYGNRGFFVAYAMIKALRYNTVIIGHINLSLIGYIIKKIKPSIRVILITHGIEVWREHSGSKKKLIQMADTIVSVSNFTKQQLLRYNEGLEEQKIKIFPNTIDPYFKLPTLFAKPNYLLNRYNISSNKKILLTVTRMAYSEKYKGYDDVIEALSLLKNKRNDFIYLICGKAENQEQERIEAIINQHEMWDYVKLIGYVNDEELNDHYLLSDVFIMPSKKEGFGIVFIEALACGRPVIAGNKDGSIDALQNGKFGTLVDPDNINELKQAIDNSLSLQNINSSTLQQEVLMVFDFKQYKTRLKKLLLA